jgi:hypothetical protein
LIRAGLPSLPRSPGLFPDWRENLLFAIGREPALAHWRAREPGDFGVMLAEMGAYVLDVTSFYDQLIANESYLGTAQLTGTQRRLVSQLGYLARPAIGAAVWLVAEADGVRLITLPAGTAVRSGAFDGNPPQIFELGSDFQVEPRINRLVVNRVAETLLPSSFSAIRILQGSARVNPGELVVFAAGSALFTTTVAGPQALMLRFHDPVSDLRFTTTITPPAGSAYADARLLKGGAACGAWKLTPAIGEPTVISGAQISLDGRYPNLRAGDIVAIAAGLTAIACRISSVTDVQYTLLAPLTSTITDTANKVVSTLLSPAIKVTVTQLTLDTTLPFSSSDIPNVVVRHTMVDAATISAPLKDALDQGDPIIVPALVDDARTAVTELMLEDAVGAGVATTGTLDAASRSATTSSTPAWDVSLTMPVRLYGNAMQASRGETVPGEVLGAGDASADTQTFRLKKKPLTYLSAANAAGRQSSLVIHVGGIAWQETNTFFGRPKDATVYIVRHTDDGETDITFGGCARIPTNASVVANYRFGAGAAVPPADSVKQITKPVAGLRKIHNILPAFGGSDSEGPAELAIRGPGSALLLGRAISIVDFEAAAAQQPGVRAAKADWGWDAFGLRSAVIVTYIGDPQLASSIQAALRALAEDDAPISVQSANAQTARVDVDIEIDPSRVPDDVIAAVSQALFGDVTLPGTGGLLQPENLGVGTILYESVVVREIIDVPGVTDLRALNMDGVPFTDIGRKPGDGCYFDFASGGVWVNGKQAT